MSTTVTQILIDPNVRVEGNETFAGFEDVRGSLPSEGEQIIAIVEDTDVVGLAHVTRVSPEDRLIYLAVEWDRLAPIESITPDELVARVNAHISGNGRLPVRSGQELATA